MCCKIHKPVRDSRAFTELWFFATETSKMVVVKSFIKLDVKIKVTVDGVCRNNYYSPDTPEIYNRPFQIQRRSSLLHKYRMKKVTDSYDRKQFLLI